MEEQIKVRDWIVARIVRIEEMVVDSKVRTPGYSVRRGAGLLK